MESCHEPVFVEAGAAVVAVDAGGGGGDLRDAGADGNAGRVAAGARFSGCRGVFFLLGMFLVGATIVTQGGQGADRQGLAVVMGVVAAYLMVFTRMAIHART